MSNTHTFNISFDTDEGKTLQGLFTYKRPSVRQKSQIVSRKSVLSGGFYCVRDEKFRPTGQGIDAMSEAFNGAVARLDTCLIQAPEWWDLDEITDEELVWVVYEEVMKFEDSFRRPGDKRDDAKTQSGSVGTEASSDKPALPDVGNVPTPVVDEEIQASLDA